MQALLELILNKEILKTQSQIKNGQEYNSSSKAVHRLNDCIFC